MPVQNDLLAVLDFLDPLDYNQLYLTFARSTMTCPFGSNPYVLANQVFRRRKKAQG